MTVGASPFGFSNAAATRTANWGSAGTSTTTSKFDWGRALKAGGMILQQAGRTSPTAGLKISGQLGFASYKALRKQAWEAPKKAEWEITRERKYRKRLIGQQSFTFGYAGVEISGTALDILEETKREMEMDEEMIYREGQLSKTLLLKEAKHAKELAEAQLEAAKSGGTAEALGWASTAMAAAALFSDKTRKENIKDLAYDIDDLMSLRPVSFRWKDTGLPDLGVIAQELKEVIPELIQGEEPNMKVNYAGIIAVLIKSVQQQQEQIKALEEKI